MSQRLFKMHRALWLDPAGTPRSFATASQPQCCEAMTQALTNDCDQHPDDPFGCADCLVSYSATFDEYGLIVHDGGASSVAIQFCPWCGQKLPESGSG